jgi:adenine-specific DNA-methyltransferase
MQDRFEVKSVKSELNRLELTWVGKDERINLEPRILLSENSLDYHSSKHAGRRSDHLVIEGDNLLGLKALEQEFTGQIKCIYIDPPYNTGSAFLTYDDGLKHSLWLSLMRSRLELLWKLLTPANGTLLISISDDECHYLKVLCDELFGRSAFYCSFVWNYEGNTDNQSKVIRYHEYILVYSKSGDIDEPRIIDPNVGEDSKLFRETIRNTVVKNGPKNPPVSVQLPKGFPAQFGSGTIHKDNVQWPKYDKDLTVTDGQLVDPVSALSGWSSRKILETFISGGFKAVKDSKGQDTVFELTRTGAIEAVKKREDRKGHVISVLRGFGTTNQMRLMLEKLGLRFSYPKPVDLIAYLIEIFTGPNDVVLDSFAGSGTTAHAVMKLNGEKNSNRRCILIELDSQTARSVIVPRLKAVADGHEEADLPGYGGGFRFFRLAPSLLEKDSWDNWIVNNQYNPEMLKKAMCKLEGFRYAPVPDVFWNHGYSTERDFIYVTTQNLNSDQLQFISQQVGYERSLLICCGAFRGNLDFPNLTVKKIPQAVLQSCEWGRDDYSLSAIDQAPNVAVNNVRAETESNGTQAAQRSLKGRNHNKKATPMQEISLFDGLENGSDEK